MMKRLLAATALLTAFASPALAQAQATKANAPSSAQSVWETVSETEIVNSDGSVTEITVVRRYYFFGVL